MLKKIIILILGFYFLTLFQSSFLVHFSIRGMVPNLVLIAVIIINLFTFKDFWFIFGSTVIGGFYLDVFSLNHFGFFGFYTLILIIISLFINFVLRRYVSFPIIEKI